MNNPCQYQSADLLICPNAGEVRHGKQSIRLSPVNMKVLMVLIIQAGETVSRQQLFDTVWPNQVVSDDALTRAIADLRAQLKPLSSETALIKTRPRVGYSWQPAVKEITVNSHDKSSRQPLLSYLGLFILAMILVYSFLSWQLKTAPVALVILPTESNHPTWAVDEALQQAVLKTEDLNFLSEHAFNAHKGNPYPYFSHEFGVRWFIESHLDNNDLTLQLVDARTALVIYSEQHNIDSAGDLNKKVIKFIGFVDEL
jgi:DNA-binding winged helix-turn-helix (wHTH) protein